MVSFGPITFGGLVSGMDTNAIIQAITDARRFPVQSLETRIADTRQRKDILRLANTQMLSLQRSSLALRLEATFLAKKVNVSQPGAVGVTAGLKAQPAKAILNVTRLAQGARAVSGLGDRSFDRAAALLAPGNTAGISNVTVTSEQLPGIRARGGDLLTETLQAGRGAARVTAGDTIAITGTRKNGSAVNVTFTFNGDSTDTLQRLGNAIQSAFGGDVQVSVSSAGQLVLTETDPAVAGTFVLSGLTFSDTDFSGSTFSIGLGPAQAQGGPVANELTGTTTFTTTSSAVIANASTLLTDLDQLTGGTLTAGSDKITITGTLPDGTAVNADYLYTAGDTLQELLDAINTAYGPGAVATLENGKIVLTDAVTGASQSSLFLTFVEGGGSNNTLNLGNFVQTVRGAAATPQIAQTTAFTVPARGTWQLMTSNGLAGSLTGTVALQRETLLGSIAGLTVLNRFTVDRDAASGVAAPVGIIGLTERSTVQDLVDTINQQVPSVTASLVDDGGGAFFLRISANRGGTDLRFTDEAGGILETLFDPTAGVDTDFTTSNATSATTDITGLAIFRPDNGGPELRFAHSQAEGTPLAGLIPGISLTGFGGNTFSPGVALLRTVENSELNQAPATTAIIFGRAGISSASSTRTPPLNLNAPLTSAGFADTVQSSQLNPVDHVDGTFTINGKQITITSAQQSVAGVLGLINAAGAGVIARYDSASDRIVLERTTPGAGSITLGAAGDTSNFLRIAGLTEAAGGVALVGNEAGAAVPDSSLAAARLTIAPTSGVFTINGVAITVDAGTDTLQAILDKITNSGAGVTATFDPVTDRVTLLQKLDSNTTATTITVGDPGDTSNLLAALRLTNTPSVTTTIGSARQRAEFTLDGVSYSRTTNTIADVLPDVTLTLQSVTTAPVSIDIAPDTDVSLLAIRDFVVAYNTAMKLLSPQPLTEDEQAKTKPLTEAQRNRLTFAEIDAYERERQELLIRDQLYRDPVVRRAVSRIRTDLFGPVVGAAPALDRLGRLGLSTGAVGTSALSAQLQQGFLVTDSIDPDAILDELNRTPVLLEKLRDAAAEVQQLFGNPQESRALVTGQTSLSFGMVLSSRLSFSIGDNLNVATVTFDAGVYTSSEVLNRITTALEQANLGQTITARFDSGGRLQFDRKQETGRAQITLQDLNAGASLQSAFGLASGTTLGPDAAQAAGLARRLESALRDYTGLNGLINRQVTTGGVLDQRLQALGLDLARAEERLLEYEARIRAQFVEVERSLARLQRDSQFLQARMGQLQQQGFLSGGGR